MSSFFRTFLYWMPSMVVFNVALYWIIVGGVFAVTRIVPEKWKASRRIGERKIRPGQIRREILTSMRSALIFSVVAAAVFAGSDWSGAGKSWFKVYGWSADYGLLWSVTATILLIVGQDTWFYWTHRLMHHPRLYRRFHQVHHKSKYPTPFTAYAFDSGEALSNAIYIAIVAIVVPYPLWALVIFMVHMLVRNAIGHSGYSLDPAFRDGRPVLPFLTSTVHHDLHHTANKGNFGLYFTFWDRVMGTENPDYLDRFVAQNRRDSLSSERGIGQPVA